MTALWRTRDMLAADLKRVEAELEQLRDRRCVKHPEAERLDGCVECVAEEISSARRDIDAANKEWWGWKYRSQIEAARADKAEVLVAQLRLYTRHKADCALRKPRGYKIALHLEERDGDIVTVDDTVQISGPGAACTCGLADLLPHE